MENNPYHVLGISENASPEEIKHAHRYLAKKYHPDTGGDENKILAINAAWEILKNKNNKDKFSRTRKDSKSSIEEFKVREKNSSTKDKEISQWLKIVYKPIDRFMVEIINKFPEKIKELSADPYDDNLMESFSKYIEESKNKLNKIKRIYLSLATPNTINNFSLSLYQSFSEIEDGINEWDIYTKGYVESYLHDGQEMLSKAEIQCSNLRKEIQHLSFL